MADAFAKPTDEPTYVVGVYGSGATCKAILDAGLAQRAWLAQSKGWSGYSAFLNSGRWALSQAMPTKIAGIECDPDTAGEGHDVGDFALPTMPMAAFPFGRVQMHVNARNGLRLRSGPGVEFDFAKLVPVGTIVYPIKTVGSWTMVGLQGDGIADGFVIGAYLSDTSPLLSLEAAASASSIAASPKAIRATDDAFHVPQLIRNGSYADGLKAARETAAASLPGYPTNGCAAHLSALLRHSGIDVAMTWGAGKLAHVLAERGWSEIAVGSRRLGDVGVCYDNDPTPPGSDHVYLVVGTSGPDEMLVADNQRKTDAPHTRYASGRGKTPTEYFLRAI